MLDSLAMVIMAGDALSTLTLVTNFLCMAISLWFAIYLLARSLVNHLTFRAVVALLALAFYYNNAFNDIVNANLNTNPVRALSVIIALIACHDLTHYLLPVSQRRKLYWIARGIVLLGVVAIVLLFIAPPGNDCDPRYLCPASLIYPWTIISSFEILFFAAILYNLWLIKKSEQWLQNVAFYEAVLLGASTIGYSLLGTALNLDLPRFIPNLLMLAALGLLLYSVAHDQTLVTRRASTYDLPVTLLTITVIVGVYILSARQIGLTTTRILLLAVLAIFTHSAYDFVREFLVRLFHRQEHRMRQELRNLAREASTDTASQRFLRRGLAILCHNLYVSKGLIALRQGDQYEVVASLHSLPIGSRFPSEEVILEGAPQPTGALMGYTLYLVPAFADAEQMTMVGVGARKDRLPFSEEDLYWLEDIAEEIGWMVLTHRKQVLGAAGATADQLMDIVPESNEMLETDELLTKLAFKPDTELISCVEEGFRNLNDYSRLGKSPLAAMLGIHAQDHLEGGKLVQRKLNEVLEKLRPVGEPPSEPLPREWYAYTILHDAYVEEKLAREIMAELYISEGTYYRLRRHALRGITRALIETGTIA
jgi:hypothetical protein